MTDAQARELLALLHRYVKEYDSCKDMTLTELADDLVISLDEPTERDVRFKDEIQAAVTA